MSCRRLPLLSAVIAAVACYSTGQVCAGPKVTVGRAVPSNQRVSMNAISHAAWNDLLKQHVDASGRVNYTAWKQSPADVAALDRYLQELSRANAKIRTSREGYLAYWINAYNAVTIKGILREYPTTSIRNHTARLYGYNIWHDLLLAVGESTISLNDIEHKVLRKAGEPRVHFAIVCASHSCPRLRNEAYTTAKLEQQLTKNTRDFFANPENFRYADGRFYLSPILKWFEDDFGSSQADLLQAISPYLPDRASRRAAASGSGRISYLSYDWSLNDQKSPRTARR